MKPTVLIVDDSTTVRMDLGETLEAAGFESILCGTAVEARSLLALRTIDLVILDVRLPDGDGIELLGEIKRRPGEPQIPVILLSTEAEVHDRIRGLRTGADEYVGKPYEKSYLVTRAHQLAAPRSVRGGDEARTTVLVIDDSATFREEFKAALESAGYSVVTAASGEEGLRVAASRRPAAVIVDGILGGGIDGTTVVRRLKQDAALRGTPCILLTASDEASGEVGALEAGADAFVRKEADHDLILARLTAVLRSAGPMSLASAPSLLGPKRVLAVDDSPTYLGEVGDELRQEGFDVVLARSGEEAIELLCIQAVDCILLDLRMPGLSGQETCRRIKASPAWRDVPLIMLTALDERESMIEGLGAGADDYITKSSDFDVLKARLRAQLRRKQFEDENRSTQKELVRKESDARFQKLLYSSIIGVVVGDLQGRLIDANDAFLGLLGYSREDVVSGRLQWEDMTTPESRTLDLIAIGELPSRGTAGPWEKQYMRRDGKRVPVLIGASMVEGTETWVGFVVDRTEAAAAEGKLRNYANALEQANRELERAKERAEQSSRFKSSFLASMSHELRTPLNAIIGFSDLLEGEIFGSLNVTQKDYVQNVLISGRHLLTLINDILDLSKVEAGRMDLHCDWTPLAAMIDVACEVVRPLADKRGVALEISIPRGLPDLFLDAVRTRQILYNLLSNGIKFTPAGGIVSLCARLEADHVALVIEDTGVGIPAEDMPRLFSEFEQLGPVSGGRPEGTGLGLALTKRLVELQGGTISVRSDVGKGSTFTVAFPISVQTDKSRSRKRNGAAGARAGPKDKKDKEVVS